MSEVIGLNKCRDLPYSPVQPRTLNNRAHTVNRPAYVTLLQVYCAPLWSTLHYATV